MPPLEPERNNPHAHSGNWLPCGVVARTLAVLLGCLAVSPAPAAAQDDSARPPNVIFILADDLGWSDTSVYGSTFYRTPGIERLARRGMTFSDAYAANPLCSPTRASILTGQYPARLRFTTPAGHLPQVVLDPVVPERGPPHRKAVTPQTRTRLPLEYHTLAEAMQAAGFATGFFGKWHLGREPYMPKRQGFDVNLGGGPYPGPPSYFSPYRIHTLPDGPPGEHITDRLTDEAIRFMQSHRDRPFLLNFWHYSVHAPYQAKRPLIDQYRARVQGDAPQRNPVMGGMIQSLDESVARLLDAVDQLGLAERTIIIFTSDNGGNMYDRVEGLTPTNNHPLRGGKATIYEGGTRVPLIVVWPGRVQPESHSAAIISSVDYFPTLADMLSLRLDPTQTIDGVSIVPALTDQENVERQAVFCHFPHYVPATGNLPCTSVRSGPWKLIRFFCDGPDRDDRFELYRLDDDIGESRNLAGAMPEKVAELDALIDEHLAATAALTPKPNPAYRQTHQGWHGNDHAELSVRDGRLHVLSSGGDPFLVNDRVPRVAGPVTLEFRTSSTAAGAGRVYWATQRGKTFHLSRSAPYAAVHDGRWHTYRVAIQLDGELTALRIDPATGPGELQFESIRLLDADGQTVAQWFTD